MATRRSDDDSAEEEATAIDLRSSSQAFPNVKKPSSSSPSQPSSPKSIAGGAPPKTIAPASSKSAIERVSAKSKASQQPLHRSDDESDEEATEFLAQRPSSSSMADEPPNANANANSNANAGPRARGRAVPLEAGAPVEKPSTTTSTARALVVKEPVAAPPPTRAAMDLPTTAPEMSLPLPKAPRPLPERVTSMKSELSEASETGPVSNAKSTPRITRIFVDPDSTPHKKIGDDDATSQTDPGADNTDPPGQPVAAKPRPLPAPGKPPTIAAPLSQANARDDERRRPKTQKTSEPSSETLEAEPADGTLIVEVPDGAVVFLDGIERGKGPTLKLKEIDRYAKHAVRIHCPGYLPWSGSVCLEGRTAAKIRPALKKRA